MVKEVKCAMCVSSIEDIYIYIYIRLGKKKFIMFSMDGCSDRYLVKYRSNILKFMLIGTKKILVPFFLTHSIVSSRVLKMGEKNSSRKYKNRLERLIISMAIIKVTCLELDFLYDGIFIFCVIFTKQDHAKHCLQS